MAKNLMGKSRKPGNGYVKVEAGGWSWEVLKMNQSLEKAKKNPFASAFMFVKSPFVPHGEMGDTYLRDVPGLMAALEAKEKELAAAAAVAA